MPAEPTLTDRLTDAAAAAIAEVAPTLEHDPQRLRHVRIELELANGGQVVGAVVWAQRRAGVGRAARPDARAAPDRVTGRM